MRRGGRGYHLQVPWRQHNDPTPSSRLFKPLKAHIFKVLIALAAFSIAILTILLYSQRHVSSQGLQSRKPGFVFPLYHYYSRPPNVSEGEMWHRRGLLKVRTPFFKLRENFYIEMKLGPRAKKFFFNIDTGSKHSWVFCKVPGHISILEPLGPNGMFKPSHNAVVKCIGDDSNLCNELQYIHAERCNWENNFECLFVVHYMDTSCYKGVFIIDSFTLPTMDFHEVKGHGIFGCVTRKKFEGEKVPLYHDGVIGLGSCNLTIVDQWLQLKLISQHIVAICIAKAVNHGVFGLLRDRMGYVAVGVDFKEKFDKSKVPWAILTQGDGNLDPVAADLSSVLSDGALLTLDTGADVSYLYEAFYDPLINEIDFFAMEKGYSSVMSDLQYHESDRRQCWSAPKDVAALPIRNFPVLTFAIKGMPSDPKDDQIRHYILDPHNYLDWDGSQKILCINILRATTLESDDSLLGSGQLREHLFVIDSENGRVRWQKDACIL